MNWKDITVSDDGTHFNFDGSDPFNRQFLEILKFHEPGIAPVKDQTGAYHIDSSGLDLYSNRYERTFGFYCQRAAIVQNGHWFHIDHKGNRAYNQSFNWVGNFQENLCTIRNEQQVYFHIGLDGKKIYPEEFLYAGDFKDGIACVKNHEGFFKHIDYRGEFLNNKTFLDLGVFHKNYATSKDERGWYHIDRKGNELYSERYAMVEPFYNGQSLVETHAGLKRVINEEGILLLQIL